MVLTFSKWCAKFKVIYRQRYRIFFKGATLVIAAHKTGNNLLCFLIHFWGTLPFRMLFLKHLKNYVIQSNQFLWLKYFPYNIWELEYYSALLFTEIIHSIKCGLAWVYFHNSQVLNTKLVELNIYSNNIRT